MWLHKGHLPVCPRNQHCEQWVQVHMSYCLCSVKDGLSLTLGMVSVISWGIAEVPQILTNYKTKSTEGLSIAFLMAWLAGDLFNLLGCMYEPATLPTQLYMALLYTATTVFLTAQTIYYSYIYPRRKANKTGLLHEDPKLHQGESLSKRSQTDNLIDEKQFKSRDNHTNGSSVADKKPHLPSSPIPVGASLIHRYDSRGRDLYIMSARSLTRSHTPTVGSYWTHTHECARTMPLYIHDQHSAEEPLLGTLASAQSAPPPNTKPLLCAVSAATFFLQLSLNDRFNGVLRKSPQGIVIQVGRKLLLNDDGSSLRQEDYNSWIGTTLGWAMAIIYMGGRLPQICKNIKRGNVEGLNPLMFIFALVGNLTYTGSILVSSLDWSKIRPNLPWLVDAAGCVILDTFILFQFIYFRRHMSKDSKDTMSNSRLT